MDRIRGGLRHTWGRLGQTWGGLHQGWGGFDELRAGFEATWAVFGQRWANSTKLGLLRDEFWSMPGRPMLRCRRSFVPLSRTKADDRRNAALSCARFRNSGHGILSRAWEPPRTQGQGSPAGFRYILPTVGATCVEFAPVWPIPTKFHRHWSAFGPISGRIWSHLGQVWPDIGQIWGEVERHRQIWPTVAPKGWKCAQGLTDSGPD